MSITISVLVKRILLIKKNRYPKISVSLFDKLRWDRLMSPTFLDPPFRWRVGAGYFSTSKLVILFIHLY